MTDDLGEEFERRASSLRESPDDVIDEVVRLRLVVNEINEYQGRLYDRVLDLEHAHTRLALGLLRKLAATAGLTDEDVTAFLLREATELRERASGQWATRENPEVHLADSLEAAARDLPPT